LRSDYSAFNEGGYSFFAEFWHYKILFANIRKINLILIAERIEVKFPPRTCKLLVIGATSGNCVDKTPLSC